MTSSVFVHLVLFLEHIQYNPCNVNCETDTVLNVS